MTGERGQTLVMVALLLVALLAITALAIDGGNAYYERRQMQTAADAGALAAARAQCLGNTNWGSAGETQCAANAGQGIIDCEVSGPGTYGSVWASASETVPTWFAGVIGLPTMSVGARAEASCEPISGTGTLLPLTIPDDSYGLGMSYTIWNKDFGTTGSYGWLRWDDADEACGNPTTLSRCIEEPSCAPYVYPGQVIDAEPGVNDTGLGVLWEEWQGQVVVIPLYGAFDSKAKEYTVSGFGAFRVTGMCDGKNHSDSWGGTAAPICGGGEKKITGQFVRYINPDSMGGGSDSDVYVVYLAD